MVDCKARLTEEIQDRFNYMVDFIKIPENKKNMLEQFGVSDFNKIYEDKVKNDLVYEKSKMTMYIENIGRKINSNFTNFIKKHIVSYVCAPDKKGNILCYDCDEMCRNCYKCVDCLCCIDVCYSINTKGCLSRCAFIIDCMKCCGLYFSKKCVYSGVNKYQCRSITFNTRSKEHYIYERSKVSYSLLLDNCEVCRDCFNLKDCVECSDCKDCIDCVECSDCKDCIDCVKCKNCINCIDCVKCRDCKDCKRCREMRGLQGDEDRNMDEWMI